ncbi:DNA repair protein RadC (plasmid) [Roseomonas marmotae]|uniref:DNA repair protein RadC n=2 Tax=Roseomonas marmotae TaxID=2768161 RepID=A0ABS3KIG9_9PROT|nr:DNA repair protein RadC [Roseomonas marmotae]QTI82135.1 DNA repair protein RadC [Roseomonas marmotae]
MQAQARRGFAEGARALPHPPDLLASGQPRSRSSKSRIGRGAEQPEGASLPFPDGTGPHGHRRRMREKLLTRGPGALADYEILEMLLFFAFPQSDTKPLAKRLINRHGSFAAVLAAPSEELLAQADLGAQSVAALKLVQDTALRLAQAEVVERPVLNSWDRLMGYLDTALVRETGEQHRMLFLDSRNRLIADETQAPDSTTPVSPRAVIRRALELHATALILVHHQPNAAPAPSRAEIERTRQIKAAGAVLSVVVHDHLILGSRRRLSFRREGLL